ncbi:MAG: hypothetical protein DCC57_04885 [Chloroflexi bacterium]|nr:MAG: hypothetical protein DCC57_04885 [Chloroflexota bacterium]
MDELNAATYVRLTVAALWDNLPQVLLGGICFSLLCAPAFVLYVLDLPYATLVATILLVWPGWTALLAFEAAILEGRKTTLGDMIAAFRRFWPPFVWPALIITGAGGLLVLALALYAVPLLVLHDQDISTALRNSAILASRYLANTFGLVSMGVLAGFAVVYVSPAFLFVLPAVCGMFIVNNCRLALAQEEKQ